MRGPPTPRLTAAFLALILAVPMGLAASQPANDQLTSATPVESLPFNDLVDLADASVTGRERVSEACGGGLERLTSSVWYRYEATGNGYVQVLAKPEASFAPSIDVFRAHVETVENARVAAIGLAESALGPAGRLADDGLQRIACDVAPASGAPAEVHFEASQDRVYYIRIGSLETADVVAVKMKEHLAFAPANDDVSAAIDLCVPYCFIKQSNEGATVEDLEGAAEPCGFHTIWYTVTAGAEGLDATWTTKGSSIHETVAIHHAATGAAGPAGLGPGTCDTSGEGDLSLLPGETAYIGLGSTNGRQGNIAFELVEL